MASHVSRNTDKKQGDGDKTQAIVPSSSNQDLRDGFSETTNPPDSGDIYLEKLICLRNGISEVPVPKLVRLSVSLVSETIVLGLTTIGTPAVTTFANILLNMSGTANDQASMGLAIVYNLWFYYGMNVSMYDKFGIDWSRSFGAKQYHITRVKFNQGAIVLVSTFALITLPSFLFGEQLLVALGSPESLSASAGKILKQLIFVNILESMGDFIKLFCLAQGHERIFGATAIFSIVPSLLVGYVLVVVLKWGVLGWICSKVTYELSNVSVGIYVLLKRTEPQTWGMASLTDIQKGLGTYFVESFKYALGSYTEFLGYIISNYFVILTHDENQIAAFTIIESLGSIVYTFGEAFATIMRTRMNILIGKKSNQLAKNFAIFFYGVVIGFCVVSQSIVFYFRDTITDVFTDNTKELRHLFQRMVLLFVFLAPVDIAISCGAVGMKTVGLIDQLVFWNFAMLIFANLALCIVFQMIGLMSAATAFTIIGVVTYILLAICIYSISAVDWTVIELQADDSLEEDGWAQLIEEPQDHVQNH